MNEWISLNTQYPVVGDFVLLAGSYGIYVGYMDKQRQFHLKDVPYITLPISHWMLLPNFTYGEIENE